MLIDYALLLMRVMLGIILAAHGSQKLFGWFDGGGIKGSTKMMQSLDIHPPVFWAYVNGICEFGGGLLTALGVLWPIGPLMIVANMLVAVAKARWEKGFWSMNGGYEYDLALLVNALALGMIGAGRYSVDGYLSFALPQPQTLITGIIVALIGYGVVMVPIRGLRVAARHHRA